MILPKIPWEDTPNFPKNLQLRKKFLWVRSFQSRLPSRKFSHIPPNGKFGKSSSSKWTLISGGYVSVPRRVVSLKTPVTSRLVTKYLDDEDQHVRRTALESAVRLSLPPPPHEDMTAEDSESVERVETAWGFLLCVFFFWNNQENGNGHTRHIYTYFLHHTYIHMRRQVLHCYIFMIWFRLAKLLVA